MRSFEAWPSVNHAASRAPGRRSLLLAVTVVAALALLCLLLATGGLLPAARAAGEVDEPHPVRHDNGLWSCHVTLPQQQLRVFYTDQHGARFGHMDKLVAWLAASHEELRCATNGGIFAAGGRPLGWLVANGVLLNPLNGDVSSPGNFFMQPNGAIIIDDSGARIETTAMLEADAPADVSHIQLALQSGPLLLQHGVINPRFDLNSQSHYRRNAICIVDASHVVLAYSGRMLNLYDFAVELHDIGCRDALYLDGDVSQMYPSQDELEPAQRRDLSVFIGVTARTRDEQTVQ